MCGGVGNGHVCAAVVLIAAGMWSAYLPDARGDELDLKKLFEESIPESPFIAVVYKYADAMIEQGRDTHGPQQTGIFLSALNRNTLEPLDARPAAPAGVSEAVRPGGAGQPLVGANSQSHQNLLRLLYFLSEMSNDNRYAQAADEELKWLLDAAPPLDSGISPWGEGMSWNVMKDEVAFASETPRYHFSRPWMLWDRCFELAPKRSKRDAMTLWHRRADSPAAAGHRNTGYLIRCWADAFAHSADQEFLRAIGATLTEECEPMERSRESTAQGGSDPPHRSAFHSLSLAIDCDGAARKTPEPLRSRLTALAAQIDAAFCALPHELSAKQGFVSEFTTAAGDSPPRRTSLWNPADGRYTTAGVGVMCVSRYTNTGNVAYRDLIVAAANAYLDSLPGEGVDAWPLAFGQAITLELAAFRITADRRYHERAFQLGQIAVERFFGDRPLPRASLNSEHYESTTGGDTLALALAELHLSTRTITAVRTPANTIDR